VSTTAAAATVVARLPFSPLPLAVLAALLLLLLVRVRGVRCDISLFSVSAVAAIRVCVCRLF
jgi:hypothetical protein